MKVSPYNLKRYFGVSQSRGTSKIEQYQSYGRWLDHPHIDRHHGETWLIAEPYAIGINAIKEMVRFCEDHDLDMFIDGNSKHNPGACSRIVFWRKIPKEVLGRLRGDK